MAVHVDKAVLQKALDSIYANPSAEAAAKALGWSVSTLKSRVGQARRAGLKPSKNVAALDDPAALKATIKQLQADLKAASKESADAAAIKQVIGSLGDKVSELRTPEWVAAPPSAGSSPGVPTLFLSDLHWGEVVHPSQINNVNKYNMAIARSRLHTCIDSALALLRIIGQGQLPYPGIVMPLGGDMLSGDIHEELQASNEMPTIPTLLDLYGELRSCILRVADEVGNVFLPCVGGNHGRNTHKIYAKNRNHTSFDWLLYQFLAKSLADDKRITFYIPDGSDAAYRIYHYRYLLTHGDQFRGGDGMIGALGPIIRGDHKKRSRNSQIDLEYDTMICGHWHQYMHLTRLIVNGSLKGYDEYAYQGNFGFESPQQAMWLTHPKHGITFRAPIYVDRVREPIKTSWVSVPG
jgi:hypothetical protein